jgi:uncharacterized protein
MKSFRSDDSRNPVHVLRFDPGEDLHDGLTEFIATSGVRNGAVVSGVGTLDQCVMHMVTGLDYPPEEAYPRWTDTPLELVGMQGVIADGEPHVHMTVSDTEHATGGHLEPGCRVLYLAELVIQEFSGLQLTREPNEHDMPMLEQP